MTTRSWFGGGLIAPLLVVTMLTLAGQADTLHAQDRTGETHADEHDGHVNSVALFLGAATHLEHDSEANETGSAIGLEYTRRVADRLRIGLLAEWASTGHERDFVFAVPFFLHLSDEFALAAGPGLEVASSDEEETIDTEDAEFLFRLGAVYELEVGSVVIGPQVNADHVDGRWTLVYGLSFGTGF